MVEFVQHTNIHFQGLSYLTIINESLHWQSSGYFSLKDSRKHFSSEKGSLDIMCLQSMIVIFDSKSNLFQCYLYFLGNSINFKTKKQSEADELFDKVHKIRYGYSLPNEEISVNDLNLKQGAS